MRTAALLLLVACDGGTIDDGKDTSEGGTPSLSITEPEDGATVEVGEAVHLLADVTGDAAVTWAIGSAWTTQGNDVDVTDLPKGEHTLEASATLGDEAVSDSIRITVVGPTDYDGTLSMLVDVHSDGYGDYTGIECQHRELSFSIGLDGTIEGTGQCQDFLGTRDFTITGTSTDTTVSGDMTSADTPDEPLPYEGSIDGAGVVTASFDKTWTNDAGTGSIRLYGTFIANPVE